LFHDNYAWQLEKLQRREEWLISRRVILGERLGSFRPVRKPCVDDFLKDLAMAAVFQGETGLKL
jgi:hypothetical protein